ncbi:MAG: hypothetical protein ACI9MR_001792 [Myxococcota bacterium]|jgi:hypothetical protein
MFQTPRNAFLATLVISLVGGMGGGLGDLGIQEAHAARVYKTRTHVDSSPAGAEMYLVGTTDELLGITPLKNVRLPRGVIKLKFTKEGYEDLVETVEIGRYRKSYVYNLVRTIKPAILEFMAAGEYVGANVSVDGQPQGQIPVSVTVPPGRHQVVIKKEGYSPWERWVEATENQKVSYDIVLKRIAAKAGQLLVTSNPSGADVRINGAPRGKTPAVLEDLAPGPYLVEVVQAGHQPFSQTVQVDSEKRTVVDTSLTAVGAEGGEVRILANVADASIFFDGIDMGLAPVTQTGVKPGVHLVEARSPSGLTATKQVEVTKGQTVVVRLELQAMLNANLAKVRIVASVATARISVDGAASVATPHTATGLEPGTHFVTVTAKGYAPWKQTVTLAAGSNPEIVAELGQSGQVDVRTKKGEVAEVFVDGEPVGKTPFVGTLPVGTRTVLVKRADGTQEEFPVAVGTDRIVKIVAAFGHLDPAKKPKTKIPEHTRPMPFSALTLRPGTGAVDIGMGYPHILTARVGGGITENMDLGLSIRSLYHYMFELEGRFKWTYARSATAAASVEGKLGAGLGTDDRNSFFAKVIAKGSVIVANKAAISLRVGTLFYTDRLGPESELATENRDDGARLLLGFSVEIGLSDDWNLFVVFDGDPFEDNRHLYNVGFLEDAKIYTTAGASYIF